MLLMAKPLSRMQSLSQSRGGSKVTKPIFSNVQLALYPFLFPGFGEIGEGLTRIINYSCLISRNCFHNRSFIVIALKYLKYIRNFSVFKILPFL